MSTITKSDPEFVPPSALPENIVLLPHRLEYVDALRGLACLGVVLYHNFGAMDTNSAISEIAQHHPSILIAALRLVSSVGWVGVPLFLCLSGFCLFLPVLRKDSLENVRVNSLNFMQQRAKRILPAYYIAAALMTIVELMPSLHIVPAYFIDGHVGGVHSVVMHALLLHNLSAKTIGEINPSFWSMAVEWQLYLVFPLLLWLVRRGGVGLLVIATLALAIAWNVAAVPHFAPRASWQMHFLWTRTPLNYAWFFALGMAAVVLVADHRFLMARKFAIGLSLPAGFASVYGAIHPLPGASGDICWGLTFTGLIIALSCVKHSYFEGLRPLAAFKHLGIFSYSVYLVHYPLLQFLHHCHLGRLVYLVGPPLVVVAGYLFFLCAEKPFLKRRSSHTVNAVV